MFGAADSVLIREVSFIQNALYIEVLLYSHNVKDYVPDGHVTM